MTLLADLSDATGSVAALGDAGVVVTDPTTTYLAADMSGLDHGLAITATGMTDPASRIHLNEIGHMYAGGLWRQAIKV